MMNYEMNLQVVETELDCIVSLALFASGQLDWMLFFSLSSQVLYVWTAISSNWVDFSVL